MVATATITPAVNAIEPNITEVGTITVTPPAYLDPSQTNDLNEPGSTGRSGVETITFSPAEYFDPSSTDKNVTGELILDINNTKTSSNMPVYREVVIVYFKEMPKSIDEFAAAYSMIPVFVKDDIKMAAFESNPVKTTGMASDKTIEIIGKVSDDSRVESVKRDTYMFVDPGVVIKTAPNVRYPGSSQKDVESIPNQVMVGFWRLPPSLEEFGNKYGGKPINVTEAKLSLQMVIYEAKDTKAFINLASKDPYVRYIEPNERTYNVLDNTIG